MSNNRSGYHHHHHYQYRTTTHPNGTNPYQVSLTLYIMLYGKRLYNQCQQLGLTHPAIQCVQQLWATAVQGTLIYGMCTSVLLQMELQFHCRAFKRIFFFGRVELLLIPHYIMKSQPELHFCSIDININLVMEEITRCHQE